MSPRRAARTVRGRPSQAPGGLQFRTRLACETCRFGFGVSSCGRAFARETMAYGRPANKIIQGKVTVKR